MSVPARAELPPGEIRLGAAPHNIHHTLKKLTQNRHFKTKTPLTTACPNFVFNRLIMSSQSNNRTDLYLKALYYTRILHYVCSYLHIYLELETTPVKTKRNSLTYTTHCYLQSLTKQELGS